MGQLRHLPAVCSCFRWLGITGVNRSLELQTDKQICSVMWEQQLGLCCRFPQGPVLRVPGVLGGSIASAPCAEPQDGFCPLAQPGRSQLPTLCRRGAGAAIPPLGETHQTCLLIPGTDRAPSLHLQPHKCCCTTAAC